MPKHLLQKYNDMPVQAKASLWYLFCSFLQKGISVISTPLFTRLLTTEEYGKLSVFNSWEGILVVFVTLRLYYGVYTQGLVKLDTDRNEFGSALIGLTTVLTALWLVIYIALRQFWNDVFNLSTSQILAMFLMMWTQAIFSFWASRQRVEYNYKKLVFLTIVVSIAKPLFGIVVVLFFPDKVSARVWELALVEFIIVFPLFTSQMNRGKKFFSRTIWKYALLFNIPLIPHYLSQTVLNSSDRIMIERMVDTGAAGIYNLAYSVSQIMTLFCTALRQTISPWFYQKIKDGKVRDIDRIAEPALIFIAGMNLLLICFAPEVVRLFAPPAYHAAIWVIPPIAMSVYFSFMYNLFSEFEFYFEKTVFIAISTGIAAILNIIMNYIFIKKFGFFAAGYTTLASYMIYAFMHFLFMRKVSIEEMAETEVFKVRRLLVISIAFLAAGFCVMMTYDHIVFRYILLAIYFSVIVWRRRDIVLYIDNILYKRRTRE